MRLSVIVLIGPLAAGALAAQRPRGFRPPPDDHTPAAMLQTVTIDVASAFDQHYRAMIEPLVFGRVAIGLSGEYTTQPDQPATGSIPYPVYVCPNNIACGGDGSAGYAAPGAPEYRAWSFNAHVRWYPSLVSFDGERQSVSVYLGEFIGYHERRTSQSISYGTGCGAYNAACFAPPTGADSAVFSTPPEPGPVSTSRFTQVLHGWEPGVEVGARMLILHHLVMDVGGRFRLATIDDPQSATRPGSVDSRLVVAVGAGW